MGNQDPGLPPDIRQQISKQRTQPTVGGIGSRAKENQTPAAPVSEPTAKDATAAPEADATDAEPRACGRCKADVDDAWGFCAKCGHHLVEEEDPAKKLGVTFVEEDLEDYLFKGYVEKDIPIFGKHKVRLRTSMTKDLGIIDGFVMNDYMPKEKRVSEFFMRQVNTLAITAMATIALDGAPVQGELAEKVKWLEGRGSAFVDMLSARVSWYNRALVKFLEDKNTLLGS